MNRVLSLLRTLVLIAIVAGAVGSVALMFRAGRNPPWFLLVMFFFWVLSPFVVLAWAHGASKRWPVLAQATLYGVSLVITLGTLAVYGKLVSPPAGSPAAFIFVAVPPASWVAIAVVVGIAALISRTPSGRT